MKHTNNKINIAFFARIIDDNVGYSITAGVINACKKHKVNLFIYDGNKFGSGLQNSVYELINQKNIHGIIGWGSSDYDKFINYYDKFNEIPVVGMTLKIKNNPVVIIDSYSGMRRALIHLIEFHDFKKIAFIRGPENHPTAKERYQAYLDVLKEYSIDIDERLISPNFQWTADDGKKAVQVFLDERKLKPKIDIQAIASVSDTVIIGTYHELIRRNINIPKEIAITGYNCSIEGESLTPPLTSVRMPFFEQGEKSVKLLLDKINGEKTEDTITLYSKLEVRQSCDCESYDIDIADKIYKGSSEDSKKSAGFFTGKNKKAAGLRQESQDENNKKIAEEIGNMVYKYLDNPEKLKENIFELAKKFMEDIERGQNESGKSFIQLFEEIIAKISVQNGSLHIWQGAISIFRKTLFTSENLHNKVLSAENLFGQARIIISDAIDRSLKALNIESFKKMDIIQSFTSLLITTHDLPHIKKILTSWLPRLQINDFCLSLYENPSEFIFMETEIPENSRLIYMLEEGKQSGIPDEGIVFFSKDFIPEQYKKNDWSGTFIIESLYFNKRNIGFFIVRNPPDEKNIFAILRNVISSCIQGALLIEEKEKTSEKLEDTLKSLQLKANIITRNTEKISNGIEDISTAMEEVAANSVEITKRISEVMNAVGEAVSLSENASEIITNLKNNSDKIGKITKIISDIAQRTNILSLNANIEAAHSGEYGKGFRVVAEEVKSLSMETVKEAENIKKTIDQMQSSSKLSNEVLISIKSTIDRIASLSEIIKEAISQQANASNDISAKLIDAAAGSKDIYNAIKEVSENKDDNKSD